MSNESLILALARKIQGNPATRCATNSNLSAAILAIDKSLKPAGSSWSAWELLVRKVCEAAGILNPSGSPAQGFSLGDDQAARIARQQVRRASRMNRDIKLSLDDEQDDADASSNDRAWKAELDEAISSISGFENMDPRQLAASVKRQKPSGMSDEDFVKTVAACVRRLAAGMMPKVDDDDMAYSMFSMNGRDIISDKDADELADQLVNKRRRQSKGDDDEEYERIANKQLGIGRAGSVSGDDADAERIANKQFERSDRMNVPRRRTLLDKEELEPELRERYEKAMQTCMASQQNAKANWNQFVIECLESAGAGR